jgi:hypothetical protein
MVRSLARIYYYFVFLIMLALAGFGLGVLVFQTLRLTPLRGDEPLPPATELTQSLVLTGVLWLVAGLLGGLHYWLIRRDIRTDPGAGGGVVRSLFLNFALYVAVVNGVPAAANAVAAIGSRVTSGLGSTFLVILPLATAAAYLAPAVLLELERRRTAAAPGAPIIIQRIFIYLFLLPTLLGRAAFYWIAALSQLVATLLANAGLYDPCEVSNPYQRCQPGLANFFGSFYSLGGLFGAVVVMSGALVLYWLLTRRDTYSALRQTQQLYGLAFGGVFAVVGGFIAFNLLLRTLLGESFEWRFLTQQANFIPALVFGLLVSAAYVLWLRGERAVSRMGAETTDLAIEAVAAAVLALPFWIGVGLVVHRLLELLTNQHFTADALGWAVPLAFVLTGVSYLPISLYLRRLTHTTGANGPRRAFVLTLLALGTITGAVGGAIALYTTLTSALGVAVDSSGEGTRAGSAVLLTGAIIAGIYAWSGVSERLLRRQTPQQPTSFPEPTPVAEQPETVEGVLDALLAGRVSRDGAASRIRELVRAGR